MSLLTTRKHWVYAVRERQMRWNELAVNGGRPYVDARLWRAPNETDVSWRGDPDAGVVGRRDRTALVNDAGRVARKIDQYIFKAPAVRAGADEAFLADVTGSGEGVDAFMQRVNGSLTHGRWCWLQCDRAPLDGGRAETLADKSPARWILWDALDVPDWRVGDDGEIEWLITRSHVYANADPAVPATDAMLFTLYRRGEDGVVRVTEEASGSAAVPGLRRDEPIPGMRRVPFVLVGRPSEKAWWFDDVENLQAQVMNLDSQHNETLMETVYPQLVVPSSLANSLEVRLTERNIDGRKVASLIRELTLGRKVPICESAEDKGVSRFIAPTGDMRMLVEEAARKRTLLFDIAGLAMFNRETRQVQTAESKQFDQLDTNATLKNRALALADAEARLVALTRELDPTFPEYAPVYPRDFDVVDAASLAAALTAAGNMADRTPKMRKLLAKAQVRVLKELCGGIATDEEVREVLDEIDARDFSAPELLPDPFAALARKRRDGDADGDDADAGGEGDATE